jgi:hypothetical protein
VQNPKSFHQAFVMAQYLQFGDCGLPQSIIAVENRDVAAIHANRHLTSQLTAVGLNLSNALTGVVLCPTCRTDIDRKFHYGRP